MNEKKTQKTYNFITFSSAKLVASFAIEMGAENVRLKPLSRGFSVSFVSTWKVELCIISLDAPCKKDYRNGIKWVQEEDDFVIDAYMCWHSIDEISDKVHRSPNSIAAALTRLGFLERAKSLQDSWDNTWDEPPYDMTFSDSKGLLDRHKPELAYWGVISVEKAYGAFSNLTQEEIDKIFKILMWFDRWDIAACFAHESGDALRAFRLARQGEDMLLALKTLNCAPNLPQIYSAQREMLNAFFRKNIIDELPFKIERWVVSAKSREKFYSDKREERPTCQIESVLDVSSKQLPENLLALLVDGAELVKLVRKGNKLAACFLADIYTQKFYSDWNHEADCSDALQKIQDGYWPTKQEIVTLLQQHLPFDENLAHKLSHLPSEHTYREKRSYYKYHLLMSHDINYPEMVNTQGEEFDDGASEWV